MQFLLTKGLTNGGRGNGARATNMIYTNMLFALGLDKVVFGQSPGWWSLAGSGLILGSAVFVAVQMGQGDGRERGERGEEIGASGVRPDGERGTEEEEMGMLVGGGGESAGEGGVERDDSENEAEGVREYPPPRSS